MKARTLRKQTTIVALALALAISALVAPAAQAQAVFEDMSPYGAVTPYGELYQHELLPDGTSVSPLPAEQLPTVVPVSVVPEPYGKLYEHTRAGLAASNGSGGIDWADAAIGAGIALGALLLGYCAALVVRRRKLAHS